MFALFIGVCDVQSKVVCDVFALSPHHLFAAVTGEWLAVSKSMDSLNALYDMLDIHKRDLVTFDTLSEVQLTPTSLSLTVFSNQHPRHPTNKGPIIPELQCTSSQTQTFIQGMRGAGAG